MPEVLFVIGHEDTPEAYWRVLLPARHLEAGITHIDSMRLEGEVAKARVVWLYQPTSLRAAALADQVRAAGKYLIVEFDEDPWARYELGTMPYQQVRLDCAAQSLAAAHRVVVPTSGLCERFQRHNVALVAPTVPLWEAETPADPPSIGWWTDGRQKRGWEQVVGPVTNVLLERDARLRHIQFCHTAVVPIPGEPKEQSAWAHDRISIFLEGEGTAEMNVHMLKRAMAPCWVGVDCYPEGDYRETVSELPLLRNASLGVPTLTTREQHYPGCVSAPAAEWDERLNEMFDPTVRRLLSEEARAWAVSRAGWGEYERVIQEAS